MRLIAGGKEIAKTDVTMAPQSAPPMCEFAARCRRAAMPKSASTIATGYQADNAR